MTKKRIVRYTVWYPGRYIKTVKFEKYTLHKGFASPKTMREAVKIADKLGKGAIIEQLSETKGGKLKVKQWEKVKEL